MPKFVLGPGPSWRSSRRSPDHLVSWGGDTLPIPHLTRHRPIFGARHASSQNSSQIYTPMLISRSEIVWNGTEMTDSLFTYVFFHIFAHYNVRINLLFIDIFEYFIVMHSIRYANRSQWQPFLEVSFRWQHCHNGIAVSASAAPYWPDIACAC